MRTRIGMNVETGKEYLVDLKKMITSKLVIQAVSGGGKSYTIRRVIEVASDCKYQVIAFDREGEFGSLRDKYDFVLAGPDGDIPADVMSAEILAKKALEHGFSLIVDLSEFKKHEKMKYIQYFLDSMISSKRNLWRDVIVVIDEAHEFAPEGKVGKDILDCKQAVVDLASLGRKRGFCGVFGTQRISKLSKDVVAECQNKLIGRTVLDIDRKRAADELGFNTKEKELSLRSLKDGEFFAFGTALTDDIMKVKIDPVATKHGKEVKRSSVASKPTAKVKEMLTRLTNLPAEATKELRDKESMANEIKSLNQRIRELERSPKAVQKQSTVSKDELQRIQDSIEQKVRKELDRAYSDQYKNEFTKLKADIAKILGGFTMKTVVETKVTKQHGDIALGTNVPKSVPGYEPPKSRKSETKSVDGDKKLGKASRDILAFLAMRPDTSFPKEKVGALTNYAHKGGGFATAVSDLRTAGYLSGGANALQITEEGLLYCSDNNLSVKTGRAALEGWLERLERAPRTIYEFLLNNPGLSYSKEDLGDETGYESKGGGFATAISKLNTLGLIVKTRDNKIQLNEELLSI